MTILDDVAERLAEVADLADREIALRRARRAYPLAAIFLGCLKLPSPEATAPDGVLDTSTVLELMDMAVVAHYHESDRPADERLIAGDHWYARAMTIAAGQGKPELVRRLAEATSDVARGQALSLDAVEPDAVLSLRSALFPAAVDLAAILSGGESEQTALDAARDVGIAREAVIAGISDADRRVREAEGELTRSAGTDRPFGCESGYVAEFVRGLYEHSRRLLDDSECS